MEDLEEIEDLYMNRLEKEDNAFLKKLNDPLNKEKKAELKKKYREMLKSVLGEYNNNVSKFLNKKDVKLFKKDEAPPEETEKKQSGPSSFKVEPFRLGLSYMEKAGIRWKVFKFRFRIVFRNLERRILPVNVILFILTAKLMILNSYIEIRFYLLGFLRKILILFRNIFIKIKSLSISCFNFFKKIFLEKILKSLPFFRGKSDKTENSKEQAGNLAEKKDSRQEKK